jgi:cullin-associated NEDD8-dissociated protein 1
VPGSAGAAALVRRASPRLASAVAPGGSPEAVAAEALEALTELLSRFGGLAAPEHDALRAALLAHLEGPRPVLRKRAIAALGALAPSLADAALAATCAAVAGPLAGGATAGGDDLARARCAAAGMLLRAAGPRLGAQLPALLPALAAHAAAAAESDGERREACLQALEAAAARCAPADVAPHAAALQAAALHFLRYDPNLADDDDTAGGGGDGDAEMGAGECADGDGDDVDDDDGDDGAYSDDEDCSWKVRRAAAKLSGALVAAASARGPDALAALFAPGALLPALVGRFREREESVRLDVLAVAEQAARAGAAAAQRDGGGAVGAALDAALPAMGRAASAALGGSAQPRTRAAAFSLLREMAAARPGALAPLLAPLVSAVARALADAKAPAPVKAEALSAARALVASTPPDALAPHLATLAPALAAAAAERYYKTAAEALRCAAACVPALAAGGASTAPLAAQLHAAAAAKLGSADADAEVKEAALGCLGAMLATCASAPGIDAAAGCALLLDRCRVDSTRLPAVRALGAVAASPAPALAAALAPMAPAAAAELTAMLRRSVRALRQASLSALACLVDRHAASLPAEALDAALGEAAALVSDADLALASAALALATLALRRAPAAAARPAAARVLPAALALLPSPLVAGGALGALRRFFAALAAPAAAAAGAPPPKQLMEQLLAAGAAAASAAGAGKHAASAVAACVGAAAAAGGPAAASATAAALLCQLKAPSGKAAKGAPPAAPAPLLCLCLGELGRRQDLAAQAGAWDALLAALDAPAEEAAEAAAAALGGLVRGGRDTLLPRLTAALEAGSQARQYELLRALRVALAPPPPCDGGGDDSDAEPEPAPLSEAAMAPLLRLLATRAEAEEEAVRAATSECLGACVVAPGAAGAAAVAFLRSHLAPGAAPPLARAVAVHGARAALVERPDAAAAALTGAAADELLAALRDEDFRVRHAAAQLLSACGHYAPALARPRLAAALPALLAATAALPSLVRTVDLGPFKHVVDDGAPLRTAAFECLATLVDACPGDVAAAAGGGAAAALAAGCADAYDVRLGAHAALAKLAVAAPACLAPQLEALAEALDATLGAKLKAEAVKQEADRHDDMQRSALRAADALVKAPGAAAHPRVAQLLAKTLMAGPLAPKYAAIAAETKTGGAAATGGDAMDTA